jgi:hypothetical protein
MKEQKTILLKLSKADFHKLISCKLKAEILGHTEYTWESFIMELNRCYRHKIK